jgi:hypothetical protein
MAEDVMRKEDVTAAQAIQMLRLGQSAVGSTAAAVETLEEREFLLSQLSLQDRGQVEKLLADNPELRVNQCIEQMRNARRL